MDIISVRAVEILDSRGNPTLKTFVTLDDGTVGSAAVPSGASTGEHEALELRDGDDHYLGMGVSHAVQHVNSIIEPEILGIDIDQLDTIDKYLIALDGSDNKKNLGANAILSVSLACARAFASYHNEPLWRALNDYYFPTVQMRFPRLFVNIINGGSHANWNVDIQEFMISPESRTPSESIEMAANVFHTLKKILDEKGYSIAVGDEGGFAPDFAQNREAFVMIDEAISISGYTREHIDLATDVAASEFFKDGKYILKKAGDSEQAFEANEFGDYLLGLSEKHNIMSFEDPFDEDDWASWVKFTEKTGHEHMIVGDDLFVTQTDRLKQGIRVGAANSILIKLNQVGTLYETVGAIQMAQEAGWKVIISHRSAETSDSFISDLAVACGADFIKAGSMSRSERLVKYNRLLEIEKIEW